MTCHNAAHYPQPDGIAEHDAQLHSRGRVSVRDGALVREAPTACTVRRVRISHHDIAEKADPRFLREWIAYQEGQYPQGRIGRSAVKAVLLELKRAVYRQRTAGRCLLCGRCRPLVDG